MKPNQQIKKEPGKYNALTFQKKFTTVTSISYIIDKPSRKDWLYHTSPLNHYRLNEKIQLISEQKKINHRSYKYQVRCPEFCDKPLFRFDSDGATHKNKNKPLGKQAVPPPHFNYYDDDGNSLAYQTEELKAATDGDLDDLSKFFNHFCYECWIVEPTSKPLTVVSGDSRKLYFKETNNDPLSNIKFDL
ncbi:MAG: hypothetical protein ABI675_21000 [Chitinophagaceae bacterium]